MGAGFYPKPGSGFDPQPRRPFLGPCQVLADLIASGIVSVMRLTEIFRQAATRNPRPHPQP
jgi:hypothetical protein